MSDEKKGNTGVSSVTWPIEQRGAGWPPDRSTHPRWRTFNVVPWRTRRQKGGPVAVSDSNYVSLLDGDFIRRMNASQPRSIVTLLIGLIGLIGLLLPAHARARYLEEWRGELYDLRAEGARWWRLAGHVGGIFLCSAPLLAVIARRNRRRAVD